MYNKKLKELFIPNYIIGKNNTLENIEGIFNVVGNYEEKLSKDCSEFTREEILDMYKNMESISLRSVMNYNTVLKAYTGFVAYYNRCDSDNAYKAISSADVKPYIISSQIITRNQLSSIQDDLMNAVDKAIIECVWEGINGNKYGDLASVKGSMINPDTLELHVNGHTYQLTQRCYDLLQKAFSEEFYHCFPNDNTGEITVIDMVGEPDSLYKKRWNSAEAVLTEDQKYRWVSRKIANIKKHYDIPFFTLKNIQDSGVVYNLKIGMVKAGIGDLWTFLGTEKGKEIVRRYGYTSDNYQRICYQRFGERIK